MEQPNSNQIIREVQHVAYKPGWLEKSMLILLLIHIILTSYFILQGSLPARHNSDDLKEIKSALCIDASCPQEKG